MFLKQEEVLTVGHSFQVLLNLQSTTYVSAAHAQTSLQSAVNAGFITQQLAGGVQVCAYRV